MFANVFRGIEAKNLQIQPTFTESCGDREEQRQLPSLWLGAKIQLLFWVEVQFNQFYDMYDMRRQKRSKEVAHVSLIYSRVIEIPKLKPADEFRWRRRWWILVERKRNYVYHNAPGDDVVGSLVPDGSLSQHQRFAQGMLTWHAQYHGIMINICLQNLNWVGAWPWETFGHWSGPYLGCNDAILEAKHSFFSSFEVCKIYRNVHLSKRKGDPSATRRSPRAHDRRSESGPQEEATEMRDWLIRLWQIELVVGWLLLLAIATVSCVNCVLLTLVVLRRLQRHFKESWTKRKWLNMMPILTWKNSWRRFY